MNSFRFITSITESEMQFTIYVIGPPQSLKIQPVLPEQEQCKNDLNSAPFATTTASYYDVDPVLHDIQVIILHGCVQSLK